jgi:hypothetical protein
MNFSLQCKGLKSIIWAGLISEKSVFKRAGFAGLAKPLAYCVQKHHRLECDTRGTQKRLKQKRVKNSKVESSEKAEKFVRRKGVREVGGKSG